jgi:NAD(P) transhydrogenase subunit beta
MSLEIINLWYVVSAALFIFGLKQLGSPATAVRGNKLSSIAMLIAVVVTLFNKNILPWEWIIDATLKQIYKI